MRQYVKKAVLGGLLLGLGTVWLLYRERVVELEETPANLLGVWTRVPQQNDPHIGVRRLSLTPGSIELEHEEGAEVWRGTEPVRKVIVRTRRNPDVGQALLCYGEASQSACAQHLLELHFTQERSLKVFEVFPGDARRDGGYEPRELYDLGRFVQLSEAN